MFVSRYVIVTLAILLQMQTCSAILWFSTPECILTRCFICFSDTVLPIIIIVVFINLLNVAVILIYCESCEYRRR